jgi:hypothetical protein
MVSYDTMLRTFKKGLEIEEKYKKEMILKLASQLEREKLVALADINKRLTEDLRGYVTKQWIGQVLPKKFKEAEKIHAGDEKARLSETKMLVKIGDEGIETTVGDFNKEVDRVKKKTEDHESEEFHKDFRGELEKRNIDPTDINQNIFKELQSKIELIEKLEDQLNNLRVDFDNRYHVLSNLKPYAGNYVKYDNDFKILDVKGADKEDSIMLNLIKFKDKLHDMIERNIAVVALEHDYSDVTDIK